MSKNLEQLGWSGNAAEEGKLQLANVLSTLAALTGEHREAVRKLLSDFDAGDVTESYREIEFDWDTLSEDLHASITELRQVLEDNGETARNTLGHARAAVERAR